jgi:hypothetical protein
LEEKIAAVLLGPCEADPRALRCGKRSYPTFKAEKFHFHGHNEEMRAALCACALLWREQMPTACVWDVSGSGGLGSTIIWSGLVWSVGGNQSIVLHREVGAKVDRCSRTWCVGYLRKKGDLDF